MRQESSRGANKCAVLVLSRRLLQIPKPRHDLCLNLVSVELLRWNFSNFHAARSPTRAWKAKRSYVKQSRRSHRCSIESALLETWLHKNMSQLFVFILAATWQSFNIRTFDLPILCSFCSKPHMRNSANLLPHEIFMMPVDLETCLPKRHTVILDFASRDDQAWLLSRSSKWSKTGHKGLKSSRVQERALILVTSCDSQFSTRRRVDQLSTKRTRSVYFKRRLSR